MKKTSYRDRQLVPHKKDKSGYKVKAKKTQKQGWILKERKYDSIAGTKDTTDFNFKLEHGDHKSRTIPEYLNR